MDLIDHHFAAFSRAFDVLDLIGLVFLIAIVSETVWDFFSGERKKLHESFANYAIALGSGFITNR